MALELKGRAAAAVPTPPADYATLFKKTGSDLLVVKNADGSVTSLVPLPESGKIDAGYLPSYVDDVMEYANLAALPVTGESGKIYVALDTGRIYRWTGSVYTEIVASPGTTDAITEGVTNLFLTAPRVRSTVLTGIDLVTSTAVSAADTVLSAIGKLWARVVAHIADVANPHGTTKAQVGLGNVDNTSDASKPVSTAQQTALNLKANLASPTFTGTVTGVTKSMVGLGNADDTSDVSKPVSTTQAAADTAALNAAKSYADGLVVGLLDDRGNYNASTNVFPSTGGSGTAGAIVKGDLWSISVGGALGGVAVTTGDVLRALVDAPGQTSTNWVITENNIGYVAENSASKNATGGYAGLTGFSINLRNVANSFTSFLTTTATAVRTWTMPDKSGTVAMTSDITGTNSGTNTGDQDLSAMVTLAGTQTLTNKTLANPVINAIDGTPIGGTTAAAGAFTTLSATGNLAVTGSVRTDQVLNSTGITGNIWSPTTWDSYVNGVVKTSLTSTGLAVTGTLSATGTAKIANTVTGYSWVSTTATVQYKIATLPAPNGSTYDTISISGVCGGWTAGTKFKFALHATNRSASGLEVIYTLGANVGSGIDFYTEADGTVSVWARLDGTFRTLACSITDGLQITAYESPSAGTPTGTLSFSTRTSSPITSITLTGLAVTGTLSATGAITTPYGTGAAPAIVIGDTQYGVYVAGGNTRIKSANSVVLDNQLIVASGGADITGSLGVTGTLSSTGLLSATNTTNWYGAHIGGYGGTDRTVIGNLSARATYGAHNGALNAWAPVAVSGSTVELQISGTTAATLDASGNLGLGVTPSAWQTSGGAKAIQVANASLFSRSGLSAVVAANAYYSTANNWIYSSSSNGATHYEQFNGIHSWLTAPSGTTGNPITFTQAMTLDASGKLLLGTTSGTADKFTSASPTASMNSLGLVSTDDSSSGVFVAFRNSAYTAIGTISRVGTTSAVAYNTSSDYRLKNITGSITTSGAYIDSLNPVEGTWKSDGSTFVGLIAHEIQEASRTNVATGTKDGTEMQAMDYSSSEIIANLIAELQSLRARVAQLEGI